MQKERMLIVDGNLFARKMFYKFRKLSTKASLSEIEPIFPKLAKEHLSIIPKRKELDKGSGIEVEILAGRIDQKLAMIEHSQNEIKIKTGVLFGILRTLIAINRDYNISNIIFCYDPMERNRNVQLRNRLYPTYKSSRTSDPVENKDFYEQLYLVYAPLHLLGITQAWTRRFEADDLLQYFSEKIYGKKKCFLATNDHDLFQILSPGNAILYIGGKKERIYARKDFIAEFGIKPESYYQAMTLCGCHGDDVPGIDGIGEKTAIKLIKEFRTAVNVFRNLDRCKELLGKKTYEALVKEKRAKFKNVKEARKLVKLYGFSDKLENEIRITKRKYKKGDMKLFLDMLKLLKFKSLLGKNEISILKGIIKNQQRRDKWEL